MAVVAHPWTFPIIATLHRAPTRFNALRRELGNVSQRGLTDRLRKLHELDIVDRTVSDHPPAVTYELTPLGHTLAGPLAQVTTWVAENLHELDAQHDVDVIPLAAQEDIC